VNVAELTMRAALEERRDHVYQAVMLDPNAGATLTLDAIGSMVDELIEAHGELVPAGIRGGGGAGIRGGAGIPGGAGV
jgi:alpha-galactosidase